MVNKGDRIKVMLFTIAIDNGGVATYFKRINKAFNKFNLESKLVYTKDNIEEKIYLKGDNYFGRIRFLKENINREKPNVIITNHGFETLVGKIAIMMSTKRVKLISVIHTRSILWMPNYKNKIKKAIVKSFIKASFKVCDKCIAVSDGLRNEVIEEGWIKEDKIKTIYNPVIEDEFCVGVKKRKDERIHIATIGWIYDVKNQIEAVEAIRELNDDKYVLHIIGGINNEEYYKKIKEQIKKYRLEKQVIFEGNKKNIFKELEKMDLLILTSKTEALPTVIIEAMAAGIPVIASNCKFGPKEIIEEKNGLIYELGNIEELVRKIDMIVNDNSIYKEIRESGIRRAENFKYGNIIKEYVDYIEEIE